MNNQTDDRTDDAELEELPVDDSQPVVANLEETAGDCFISYTRRLTLPAVTISCVSSLQTRLNNLGRLKITNKSNFSYSISLLRVPEWLTVEPAEQSLESGQEAFLALGVDQSHLPPGHTQSVSELVMRRPFISRSYPFEVSINVDYVPPVPLIEVMAESKRGTNTLRIMVRNAGGGLLQGYYYDRNRNEHKTFLLAGNSTKSESQQQENLSDQLPTRPTHSNQFFRSERDFQDLEEVSRGILIACDCINEKFRRFEIAPETYFKREPLANLPLIDFMQVEVGRSHEREIIIRHPAFREGCSIMIPTKLQRHVKCIQLARGKFRFAISAQAFSLGCVADHVEFKSSNGTRQKLPIIISFKESTRTA